MFFLRGADSARANVQKYERQLDKTELKHIMYEIDIASKRGYTGLKWRGDIRKTNIRTLKNWEYIVEHYTYSIYEISW